MPTPPVTAANPKVISTAFYYTDTFTYDPLNQGEVISQSVTIAPSLGVLSRGTVLFTTGALGTPPVMPLTTVVTGGNAFAILAQDTDTGTGSAVSALVFTQGKFLDTSLVFSANGAKSDAAALWQRGIYVLTVLQRSGILVPMTNLPTGPGAMPQDLTAKEAQERSKEEVERILAAMEAWQPGMEGVPIAPERKPGEPAPDPSWAVASAEAAKKAAKPNEPEAKQEPPKHEPPPPKHTR